MPNAFELRAGDGSLIGRLIELSPDGFWLHGRFQPGPGWPSIAHVFAQDLTLLEQDRIEELQSLWASLQDQGVVLVDPDRETVITEFMVHIDGETGWLRY